MVVNAGGSESCQFPGRGLRATVTWRLLLLALLSVPGVSTAESGGSAAERRAAYIQLLQSKASAGVRVKLDAVNRFFNALHYRSDRSTRGQADHWSTPTELLTLGAGDCEDLAIGKYFALRRLGISATALRITYVRDVSRNRPHMVLVYRPAAAPPRVLDSQSNQLSTLEQRRDLVPIYGFNERRVTVVAPDGARHSFPHEGRWRIRQWDVLLRRAASVAAVSNPVPLLAQASAFR